MTGTNPSSNERVIPDASITLTPAEVRALGTVLLYLREDFNDKHPAACAGMLLQAYKRAFVDAEMSAPQAPIAWVVVADNGGICASGSYAPGLPPGQHDLYCEPEKVAPYLRSTNDIGAGIPPDGAPSMPEHSPDETKQAESNQYLYDRKRCIETLREARNMLNTVAECTSHDCEDCREHAAKHRNAIDALLRAADETPAPLPRIRLKDDIYDDGADHHPPGIIAHKGDVLEVRELLSVGAAHPGASPGKAFIVRVGEFEQINAVEPIAEQDQEPQCDHPRSELLARKGNQFEMRKCLDCTKIFRVRLRTPQGEPALTQSAGLPGTREPAVIEPKGNTGESPALLHADMSREEVDRVMRQSKASTHPVPACANPVMVTAERYRGCVLPSGHEGECSAQNGDG